MNMLLSYTKLSKSNTMKKKNKGYPYSSSSEVNRWIFVLSVYSVHCKKKKNEIVIYFTTIALGVIIPFPNVSFIVVGR